MIVDAIITSDYIFGVPKRRVGKFITNNKNDNDFLKKKEINQDKLTHVLIELVKANKAAVQSKNNDSPSIKRKLSQESISSLKSYSKEDQLASKILFINYNNFLMIIMF